MLTFCELRREQDDEEVTVAVGIQVEVGQAQLKKATS